MFVQAGVDTVVAVPTALDEPTADTTQVPSTTTRPIAGDCDDFAGSANADIANNFGLDCQGIRTPYSARTTYNLQGKLNYTFGTGSRISLTALGSQFQGRTFVQNRALIGQVLTYGNLYNPDGLLAFRNWSRNVTLNWTQNLSKSAERALALETYLSYQQDNTVSRPDDAGERARHPRSVRRVHDQPDRSPVRLRQLPDRRRADQQLPAQHRRQPALAARPGEPRRSTPRSTPSGTTRTASTTAARTAATSSSSRAASAV